MMLSRKHVTKHRTLFTFILCNCNNNNNNNLSCSRSYYHALSRASSSSSSSSSSSPSPFAAPPTTFSVNDVADSFKTWFMTRNRDLLGRIYQILGASHGGRHLDADELASIRAADMALSQLSLPLTESFVLEVLRYGDDVLSCLKFFDWAGRQPGFYHTRATFTAIFKILSRANLRHLILDFLTVFRKHRYTHRVRFNDTLVVGYAIAGKPDIALHLFGQMRFRGLDLDPVGYHILLNALVETKCFNAFDVIVKQIRMRGFENQITNAIIMKNLCKQNRLDEAEAHLSGLVSGGKGLFGSEVTVLIGALCNSYKFNHALKLVRKFGKSGLVPMENAYGAWIRGLVQAGRLNVALEFLQQKKESEGYIPGLVWYNMLICRLLRENRLGEAYDLFIEMNEMCIPPDLVTMNAVLCFFCKAGMVNVAHELYNSRSQFGLSLNRTAYKYLILTLCWDGSINEAYSVWKSSVDQGYFPDKRTFSTLANALCRECKVEEMKELLDIALERNFVPSASTYDKFISALCRAGRVEDGYLMHGELDNATSRLSYLKLINGLKKSNKGDIAARLLIEMRGKGHKLTRPLCRAVLHCLHDVDTPEAQFFNLLEMLSRHEPDCHIYNCFIDGAGHAKKPEWAREVFDLMQRNGVEPNLSSRILMSQSYLKSERISDALNFFSNCRNQGMADKKLYNFLIVGLCKFKKADTALDLLFEMIKDELTPSIQCFEVLVQQLCSMKRYHEAISLIDVYEKMGRKLTSFLGNVLLFHSLISSEVYNTCVHLRGVEEGKFSGRSMLPLIIGAYSGRLRVNHCIEDLEELIAKCFPLDIYTYNLLLRKASNTNMDQACELFNRMCRKGYEPNQWTYDTMVHGFSKHGMKAEAKQWVEEMFRKGFYATGSSRMFT